MLARARWCVCDQGGFTGIIIAAENGHLEVVKLLLDNGADVDQAEEVNQLHKHIPCSSSSVHSAPRQGKRNVSELLCSTSLLGDHQEFVCVNVSLCMCTCVRACVLARAHTRTLTSEPRPTSLLDNCATMESVLSLTTAWSAWAVSSATQTYAHKGTDRLGDAIFSVVPQLLRQVEVCPRWLRQHPKHCLHHGQVAFRSK